MTLDPSSARLILFMLGKGASRIRPGEYTAEQTLEMEDALKAIAFGQKLVMGEPDSAGPGYKTLHFETLDEEVR